MFVRTVFSLILANLLPCEFKVLANIDLVIFHVLTQKTSKKFFYIFKISKFLSSRCKYAFLCFFNVIH